MIMWLYICIPDKQVGLLSFCMYSLVAGPDDQIDYLWDARNISPALCWAFSQPPSHLKVCTCVCGKFSGWKQPGL